MRFFNIFVKHIFSFALAVFALGCIENDIPYPVEEIEIVSIQGEGFTLAPNAINRQNRSVTLSLGEQTDIRRVKITSVELSNPSAESSVDLVGEFDLRTPLQTTLSLYQDYLWTIVAEQNIPRSFTVEGQIGATEWDYENHIARAFVPEEGVDLTNIKITSLKLGPEGITTMTPSAEELTSFESVRYVDICYHGDIRERWYLYVIPTEVTVSLTAADAWSRVIWLEGSGKSGSKMGFRYRLAGEQEWIEVPDVEIQGGVFKARLAAVEQTSYEVVAYCDEDSSVVRTVTTDPIAILPNCGLEEWSTIDDIIYPYLADADPFWGTGNVGASVAGATLTDKNSDVRPGSEGIYSARLVSRYANVAGIGKFAAGNIYTGTYVKNVGTNGVITFGRPFELRPTALRAWIKYNCGAVDRIKGLPAGSTLKEGDPDFGVVYIALGTWTKEEYGVTTERDGSLVMYGNSSSPICIDTRYESSFFDPYSKDVVGYGELLLDYSIEDWTQVTIPINYVATDIRPTHIVVVFSSSRYGDYFTGSTKSVMFVDDVELLYD